MEIRERLWGQRRDRQSETRSDYKIATEAYADNQQSKSRALRSSLTKNSKKVGGLFITGAAIGTFDGLNALYVHLGNSGTFSIVAYQTGFMVASGAAAFLCLSEHGWSKMRKLSTMFATLFIATIADNISIDVQASKPYVLWIPTEFWEWRNQDFGHTLLAPLANLTDGRTFGILDGYLISIAALTAYVGLQYRWNRSVEGSIPNTPSYSNKMAPRR